MLPGLRGGHRVQCCPVLGVDIECNVARSSGWTQSAMLPGLRGGHRVQCCLVLGVDTECNVARS